MSVVKKLTVFCIRCCFQVLDMAAVLEVVTILERLPITKEALEVNCRRFSLRVTTFLFNIFPVREKV